MRRFLILNDGTDEIFNLHSLEANTPEEAVQVLIDLCDRRRTEWTIADLTALMQDLLSLRFLEVTYPQIWPPDYIAEIMESNNGEDAGKPRIGPFWFELKWEDVIRLLRDDA